MEASSFLMNLLVVPPLQRLTAESNRNRAVNCEIAAMAEDLKRELENEGFWEGDEDFILYL